MRWDNTEEWQLYQDGIDYNNKIDLYAKTDLNWNFYNGDQWKGIVSNGLPTPVFNIARSAINYFVASIMSQGMKIQYSAENIPDEPDEATPEGMQQAEIKQVVDIMSKYVDLKWEKDKVESILRDGLLDGANTGDIAVHFYWDANKETGQDEKGDYTRELIDGVNVMFGNPNNRIAEKQPYILIVGRDTVKNLKEEAKRNKISSDLIESITSDEETTYQAGQYGKVELDSKGENGKCLYLIKYWKKNGKVYWNKSTRYCPVRKDVELGISRYPVAWANWEKVKNSYHGMPVMSGIIPNQIIINQLFAMIAYWMRYMAFGKTVYNKSFITSWTNQLGTAIGVDADSQTNISNLVTQLQAGNFNSGVLQVIDSAIKYTKDFIGASDAALGQINPDNTSAIIAVQKAAAVPLENVQANIYQLVEDMGLIEWEFMTKKYSQRTISYRQNGKVVTGTFDSAQAANILPQCKVDVGPSSHWSEIVSMQTLDNLLNGEKISMIQYLKRIPNGIIPEKQELIDEMQAAQDQAMMMEQQQGQWEQMAQWIESQPPEVQQQIMSLPPEQKEQVIQQMMATQQTPQQVSF